MTTGDPLHDPHPAPLHESFAAEGRGLDPSYGLPDSVKSEISRRSWLDFAGVMLMLVGAFNIIDGLAAISGSSYVVDKLLFASLDAWGWFFLIWGIFQIVAGLAVMRGAGWGAVVGIVTAFVNAIAQLSAARTNPVWSLAIITADALVIYGLVQYGGERAPST
jgi:hypothetical protein